MIILIMSSKIEHATNFFLSHNSSIISLLVQHSDNAFSSMADDQQIRIIDRIIESHVCDWFLEI